MNSIKSQITEDQVLAISARADKEDPLRIKTGESMQKCIKRMATNRKRELACDGRIYPTFRPGMTTRTYVHLFFLGRDHSHLDMETLGHRAAPTYVGAEVIAEALDE